jgi:hypothetical protein
MDDYCFSYITKSKKKPEVVGIFVMAICKFTHANNTFNEVHEFGIHMGL